MPERPLLLFPTPELADRSNLGGGGKCPRPTHAYQGRRIAPKLDRLQAAFQARRAEVQRSPIGNDPDQVLVIETVGSVEDFAKAVAKIEGLEWMGEIEIDELLPEPDFIEGGGPVELQQGRLYLIMTDQRALDELLALWRQFRNDQTMNFQQGALRGYGKFKDVFMRLNDIRRWDVQDRLADTGILEDWRESLQRDPLKPTRFEAELWYRQSLQRRDENAAVIRALVEQLGGRIVGQCVIEDIAYHSLLGEIPAQAAQSIIGYPEVSLTKCDSIMFFRPVGQMASDGGTAEGELSEYQLDDQPPSAGEPVIALLDGLPLQNHRLLAGRIVVDDPLDWGTDYPAIERQHGTAMASLIVQGDLNEGEHPLTRPIYVRPVMCPNVSDWRSPREEHIPESVLLVDHIHQAVRRLYEPDGQEQPVAPTVRIINFSIGDPDRQFTQMMSPLARLLDWLAWKYNVLFVVSAGNHHRREVDTGLTIQELRSLGDAELEALVVTKLCADAIHRRLLSPAESINAITVGAVHQDNSLVQYTGGCLDALRQGLPSPISPFGGGYRRAIKPDLLLPGGRVYFAEPLPVQGSVSLRIRPRKIAPGILTAVPGTFPGDTGKCAFSCGTSNAAALASRTGAIYHEFLIELLAEHSPGIDPTPFVTPLLKAMLVHGCAWGAVGECLPTLLNNSLGESRLRSWIARWAGYGIPDTRKVMECSAERATLIGFGHLSNGQAHVYNLPLPPSLAAIRQQRRLTVTLAWLSPVASRTQKYRACHLWFEVSDQLALGRRDGDWQAVRRGTLQHEIFEGERAVPISDGDVLQIKVNHRNDAVEWDGTVPYGLVVSLEVAEGVELAIYDEIRTRIAPAIEIRPQEAR